MEEIKILSFGFIPIYLKGCSSNKTIENRII